MDNYDLDVLETAPKRRPKNRLKFIIGGAVIGLALVVLIFTATQNTAAFFLTVEEVYAKGVSIQDRNVRVSGKVIEDHARYIHAHDLDGIAYTGTHADQGILATVSDHDAQIRAELRKHDIPTILAQKDVAGGIQTVNRLFKQQTTGKAGLYLFDDLPHLREEIRNYHYKPGTDLPEKVNDHAMDALRYLCMWIEGHRTPRHQPVQSQQPRRYQPPPRRRAAVQRR